MSKKISVYQGERNTKCPYCGGEMNKGYVVTDGRHIAFREEKYQSAKLHKNDENGIQLAFNWFGAAFLENANCCDLYKKIAWTYEIDKDQMER